MTVVLILICRDHAVPPDIVDSESSGDVMVTEGQNTTLRCSATGHPLPVITWRREDGRPIHNHGIISINKHMVNNSSSQKNQFSFSVWIDAALTVEGPVLHLTRIPRQNIGAYLCIGTVYPILISIDSMTIAHPFFFEFWPIGWL